MDTPRGKVVLNAVPDGETVKNVVALLSKYNKTNDRDKLQSLIHRAPVVLSKNVPEATGTGIVSKLNGLGASAAFIPEQTEKKQEFTDTNAPAEEKTILLPPEQLPNADPAEFTATPPKRKSWRRNFLDTLIEVNKELWLVLSILAIIGLMNFLVAAQHMLLGLYTLPTLLSAYFFGRRHAVLTAVASILVVGIFSYIKPGIFDKTQAYGFVDSFWYDITAWGGILIITAYAMGSLYEQSKARLDELRSAYRGLLVILRQFISKDKYTENHCYRVSIYAAKIAAHLGFKADDIEDLRAAALLHDIGKIDIGREILYKASRLSKEEQDIMKKHVHLGGDILDSVSGPLDRIIPTILGHHDKYDGSGYHPVEGEEIPIAARVLSVADVYDALTSDRPYRKAMSPFEAKEIIEDGAKKEFDPRVVTAFLRAFRRGEMEVPNLVV